MYQAYFGLVSSPLLPTLSARPKFDALPRVPVCVFFITELNSKIDLQTLSGETLSATSGSSSPGPVPATSTLLCPYVNLLLCNAQPSGEEHFGSLFCGEVICFYLQCVPNFPKYTIRVWTAWGSRMHFPVSLYSLECSISLALAPNDVKQKKIHPSSKFYNTWERLDFFFCRGDTVVFDLTRWGVSRLHCVQLFKASLTFV